MVWKYHRFSQLLWDSQEQLFPGRSKTINWVSLLHAKRKFHGSEKGKIFTFTYTGRSRNAFTMFYEADLKLNWIEDPTSCLRVFRENWENKGNEAVGEIPFGTKMTLHRAITLCSPAFCGSWPTSEMWWCRKLSLQHFRGLMKCQEPQS